MKQSGTISTATTEIVNNHIVEEIVRNNAVIDLYADDLIQEIYLILLQYDQIKIEEIYNKGDIKFFISRIVSNQYRSKNSPFYMNYKRYFQKKTDITQFKEDDED